MLSDLGLVLHVYILVELVRFEVVSVCLLVIRVIEPRSSDLR